MTSLRNKDAPSHSLHLVDHIDPQQQLGPFLLFFFHFSTREYKLYCSIPLQVWEITLNKHKDKKAHLPIQVKEAKALALRIGWAGNSA